MYKCIVCGSDSVHLAVETPGKTPCRKSRLAVVVVQHIIVAYITRNSSPCFFQLFSFQKEKGQYLKFQTSPSSCY